MCERCDVPLLLSADSKPKFSAFDDDVADRRCEEIPKLPTSLARGNNGAVLADKFNPRSLFVAGDDEPAVTDDRPRWLFVLFDDVKFSPSISVCCC